MDIHNSGVIGTGLVTPLGIAENGAVIVNDLTAYPKADRTGLRATSERHAPGGSRTVSGRLYRSEVAEGYQKRLLTYQDKLFTFLQHDGVPLNNNNAEHAVKRFAYYREIADGYFSETGLQRSTGD